MTREDALRMMSDILDGLRRSGLAEPGAALDAGTVLIGAGAVLDSVGFVTFVSEVEDRIGRDRDQPLELVLTDVWEFNADDPSLTAGALADYCSKIVAGGS